MRLNREEQAEYDSIIVEAFAYGGTTAQKGARFESLLLDAEQAQRWWATHVLDEARRQGLIARGGRDFRRLNEVPVSYKGELLSMPAALSARRRNESGEQVHQLGLIEFWSWDDVLAKVAEIGRTIKGYEATLAGLARLLHLRERFPDSAGPAEACRQAGTSIEQVVQYEAAS